MRGIFCGVLVASLLVLLAPAVAQEDKDFEEFVRQQEEGFLEFREEVTAQFEAFVEAERAAFEAFKQEVERQWGEYVGSTQKDWVEYSEDLSARTRVDFEKGEAKVEVLVSPEEDGTSKLQKAVEQVVTDRGKTSDYKVQMPDGKVDAPKPLGKEPVLSGQVQTSEGKPVTKATAKAFAREVVTPRAVEKKEVVGKDRMKRVKVSVTFSLVPGHLQKRAKQYVSVAKKYADRYDLDPALVYAVMHTESWFNPKAKSHAPAYGLMQLVPTSGGRAAYQYVYKKDKVLPPTYFYVPEQNVELGCAYLHFLRTNWFKGVQDDQTATYCIVAAYNTGAGNVSRAITGDKNARKAVPEIQKMTSEELYAKLRKDLPYEETRGYIKLVRERTELYLELR